MIFAAFLGNVGLGRLFYQLTGINSILPQKISEIRVIIGCMAAEILLFLRWVSLSRPAPADSPRTGTEQGYAVVAVR